jgi:DNA-binding transcriptional LysR family regulator
MPASASSDLRPSLRELEVLRAMVEARKTTAAASRLGVSQPAVSRAIQQLEHRLGRPLFRRDGGRLEATSECLLLYREAGQVLDALDRLGRGREAAEEREQVRLIAPPTQAHRFLPPLVAEFRRREPETRLQIEVSITSDVIARVADGDFEIGITDGRSTHQSVAFSPFRRSEAHVVLRADDPLAELPEISPVELAGRQFIALTRRFNVRAALERACRDAGRMLNIVAEVSTAAIAFEMVRNGVGVAVLNPFPLAWRAEPEVAFRPFRPVIPYETCFVYSSATPPGRPARRFMDLVRQLQPEDGYSHPIRESDSA